MSLKVRLASTIVALALAIVGGLSALSLAAVASARFEDTYERGRMIALQAQELLMVRLRSLSPPPATAGEVRKAVREDEALGRLLRDLLATSRAVVAIAVTAPGGEVLAASDPGLLAHPLPEAAPLAVWQSQSIWRRLAEIFRQSRNYEVDVALAPGAFDVPWLHVRVLVSSVLLRAAVAPLIRELLLALCISLLAALAAAALAVRFALRPLDAIAVAIDRIAHGESAQPPAERAPAEVAAVQSRLDVLGQQFRGAREEAQQARNRVEALLERLEEAILLFDGDGKLLIANRAAEDFLRVSRWQMIGRPMEELLPPSTALGAVVHSAVGLRTPLHQHLVTIDRNGAAPANLLVDVELLEAFGSRNRGGACVTLRDAETRRQIGAQLDVAARLAAIGRITGGVAHEIKNPLNAIALHLEVMKAKMQTGEADLSAEADVISREISRLDRVVKTFLDFTRPVELRLTDFDLNGIVLEVAELVKPQAASQRVAVHVSTAERELRIRGDRDLVKQAALNLIVNAVEAMKSGGDLRLQARAEGPWAELMVADTGPGIPPEVGDKIFNLYYSTKAKGSGIGLSVAFRVAHLHGGAIDFSSEPGKGATFRLRFPALAEARS